MHTVKTLVVGSSHSVPFMALTTDIHFVFTGTIPQSRGKLLLLHLHE